MMKKKNHRRLSIESLEDRSLLSVTLGVSPGMFSTATAGSASAGKLVGPALISTSAPQTQGPSAPTGPSSGPGAGPVVDSCGNAV